MARNIKNQSLLSVTTVRPDGSNKVSSGVLGVLALVFSWTVGGATPALAKGVNCDVLIDHCGTSISTRVVEMVDAACGSTASAKEAKRCASEVLAGVREQLPSNRCLRLLHQATRLRISATSRKRPCPGTRKGALVCRMVEDCSDSTMAAFVDDDSCLETCVDALAGVATTTTTTPPSTTTSTTLIKQPVKFVDPRVGEFGLGWCRRYWDDCGQPAADAFCRLQGFARAIDFAVAHDIGDHSPVLTINDGVICGWDTCDGFTHVTCDGEGARFVEPRLATGYRLDKCYEWGSGCELPAATAFCAENGFVKAMHYVIDPDVGARDATQLIGSGEICGASFCDAFKIVDCIK